MFLSPCCWATTAQARTHRCPHPASRCFATANLRTYLPTAGHAGWTAAAAAAAACPPEQRDAAATASLKAGRLWTVLNCVSSVKCCFMSVPMTMLITCVRQGIWARKRAYALPIYVHAHIISMGGCMTNDNAWHYHYSLQRLLGGFLACTLAAAQSSPHQRNHTQHSVPSITTSSRSKARCTGSCARMCVHDHAHMRTCFRSAWAVSLGRHLTKFSSGCCSSALKAAAQW